jgi:hypothetical protein
MEEIKGLIDKCSKQQHIDIYKIFKKHNVPISENKNGSFINLSLINDDVIIAELNNYLKHLRTQENELKEKEDIKQDYHNTYF